MKALPAKEQNGGTVESVHLEGTFREKFRGFTLALICCALLVAAFAISAIWKSADGSWFHGQDGLLGDGETDMESSTEAPTAPQETAEDTTVDNQEIEIPDGATPVIPMDLAYLNLGENYIHNETAYRPDVPALREIVLPKLAVNRSPAVLILHTHSSESFLENGTTYVEGNVGDATYSKDETRNVLALGDLLCRTLNQKGITALHCTVMHDDPSLRGSYDRAAQTVKAYLKQYPEIVLVIDLHRDAVMTSDGEFVRSVSAGLDEPVAQVMAVVGTDGNGTPHDTWKRNLALAVQLRDRLNQNGASVCRPISLRNASYNQELSPMSLLLEIGTGGNAMEEAERAVLLVGEALAALLTE